MFIWRTLLVTVLFSAACGPSPAASPGERIWLTQDVAHEKGLVTIRDAPDPAAKRVAEWRWDAHGAQPDRTFRREALKKDWVRIRLSAERTGWIKATCAADTPRFIAFLIDRILLMEEYAAGTGRFAGLLPLDRTSRLAELKARAKDQKRAARVLVDCLTRYVRHEQIRKAIRASAMTEAHKKSLLGALGENDAAAAEQLIAKLRESDHAGSVASKKLAAMGPAAVDALLGLLKDPDRRVRYWAIPALCGTRDLRAVAPVAEVLRTDKDVFVRSVAAYHLRLLPAATDALIAQLRTETNASVARWLTRGLVEANRREAADVLAAKTEHADEKVRLYALKGIVKFSVAGAHRKVLAHAGNDRSANVRGECIKLLGDLGRKGAKTRAVLAAELDAAQPARLWHAVKALRKLAETEHGYDPRKTAAENADAIAKWKAWCKH